MNNLYAVFFNDKCVGIIPRVYYTDNHLNAFNRIKAINKMFSNMGFNGYSDYLQCLPGKDSNEIPIEVQTNSSVEEYDVLFKGSYGKSRNTISVSFKDIGIDLKYTSWMCNPKRNDGDECMFLLQPSTSDVRKVGYSGINRLWFCSDWDDGMKPHDQSLKCNAKPKPESAGWFVALACSMLALAFVMLSFCMNEGGL